MAGFRAEYSAKELASAVSAAQDLLDRAGFQAALVVGESSREPDIAHFVGASRLGECFLVIPRSGSPRLGYSTQMEREEAAATGFELSTPEAVGKSKSSQDRRPASIERAAALRRALQASGVEQGGIVLAGGGPAGDLVGVARQLEEWGWRADSGTAIFRRVRKRKLRWQIGAAHIAAAATVEAMRRVAEILAVAQVRSGEVWFEGEPLKAGRLRAEIASIFASHGLEQPKGNIVAAGRVGAVPHNSGSSAAVLTSSTSIVVDLFPRGTLFADCTRTFCVGPPADELRRAHGTVLRALTYARDQAAPGREACTLQEGVCDLFEKAGYETPSSHPGSETGYVHNLGHGVGLELHELPSFRKSSGSDGRLEAGDLITLEPGLYDPRAGWAVRLEDMFFIGDEGIENLTPLPYDLDPRAW